MRTERSVTASERLLATGRPVDLGATLSSLARGRHDPSVQLVGRSSAWWVTRTPAGIGTLRLQAVASEGSVRGEAWGDGATWLLDQLPSLVGERDDSSGFEPHHDVVEQAMRRHRKWRVPRTGRVFEACLAAVIEQKVTGHEARQAWVGLLKKFGVPAPGPTPTMMLAPPAPQVCRQIPEWEFRRLGVTPQRMKTVKTVASAARALERCADESCDQVDAVLQGLPGVGPWTSAETRQRALGDADAISVGDFHVAKDLCWWLTGEVGDDERMLELLSPYAGHRYRVQRLMELEGVGAPRRGPRFAPPAHRKF